MKRSGYRPAIRVVGPVRRLLSVGRNPLRRRCDRAETVLIAVLALLLVAAMAIGVVVGSRVADHERQSAARQRAGDEHTVAVLLAAAPDPGMADHDSAAMPVDVPVPARWHGPDGWRTGQIDVAPATPAGTRIGIWLDRTGRPTVPPPGTTRIYGRGVLAGLGVPATAGLLALLVFWTARGRWDRVLSAEWEREWERVEPIWTHRRHHGRT